MRQAVFDLEANAADPREVSRVWCLCIKDVDKPEVLRYEPERIPEGLVELVTYDRIIGHNILTYDLPVLAKHYGLVYKGLSVDTLILSRLSNPDRVMPWGVSGPWRPHSLDAWSVRLGMQRKIEHEDWSQFSPEMMARCSHDVVINDAVYKALCKEFKE